LSGLFAFQRTFFRHSPRERDSLVEISQVTLLGHDYRCSSAPRPGIPRRWQPLRPHPKYSSGATTRHAIRQRSGRSGQIRWHSKTLRMPGKICTTHNNSCIFTKPW
jgi:hypothetical protein